MSQSESGKIGYWEATAIGIGRMVGGGKGVPQSGEEKLNIQWDKVPSNGEFEVLIDGLKYKVSVVPAGGTALPFRSRRTAKPDHPNRRARCCRPFGAAT